MAQHLTRGHFRCYSWQQRKWWLRHCLAGVQGVIDLEHIIVISLEIKKIGIFLGKFWNIKKRTGENLEDIWRYFTPAVCCLDLIQNAAPALKLSSTEVFSAVLSFLVFSPRKSNKKFVLFKEREALFLSSSYFVFSWGKYRVWNILSFRRIQTEKNH